MEWVVNYTDASALSTLVGVLDWDLGSYTATLLSSRTGCSPHVSLALKPTSQSWLAFSVLSFFSTFIPLNPSLIASCKSAALVIPPHAGSSLDLPSSLFNPTLVLQQTFVVGSGVSTIPTKLVTHIVFEKFADLCDLVSSNTALTKPEP